MSLIKLSIIKFLLIVLLVITNANISYASDMPNLPAPQNYIQDVEYAYAVIDASNKNFNNITNNIIKNFKNDSIFISQFKKDLTDYKASREKKVDIIFTRNINYGLSRESTTASYIRFLNSNKLQEYKTLVNLYCISNEDMYSGEECSNKRINSLFK